MDLAEKNKTAKREKRFAVMVSFSAQHAAAQIHDFPASKRAPPSYPRHSQRPDKEFRCTSPHPCAAIAHSWLSLP